MLLTRGHDYLVKMELAGRVEPETLLLFLHGTFGGVDLLSNVGASVTFLVSPSRDIRLADTSSGRWSLVWPLALTLEPVAVVPRAFALVPGRAYDLRFVAKGAQTPASLTRALEQVGFDVAIAPLGVRGAWIARGTWAGLAVKVPYIQGPVIFEQIANLRGTP